MIPLLISHLSEITLFGLPLIDLPALQEMLTRFLLNTLVVGVIVHFLYYPKSQRRDYYFTFLLLSVSIFMLIYLMDGSKIKVGAALGLFAVFGIIRYRTESIVIRDMTYLFFIVALSVVNAMSVRLSVIELLIANALFFFTAWIAESNHLVRHTSCKFIKYDNIELIRPEKRAELIADLEKRTGLKVIRVEIGTIDFLRDCTLLKMHYIKPDNEQTNSVNTLTEIPKRYDE
jgi:hypothetical protein